MIDLFYHSSRLYHELIVMGTTKAEPELFKLSPVEPYPMHFCHRAGFEPSLNQVFGVEPEKTFFGVKRLARFWLLPYFWEPDF